MVGFRLEIVHNSRLYIAVQDAGQWMLLGSSVGRDVGVPCGCCGSATSCNSGQWIG